jgi:hypothetical protein
MVRYTDGGIFAILTTRGRLPLSSVNRQHQDQKFTLVLLNRGGNLITIFFRPLLQPEEIFEIPPSTPGIVLDDIPYEKLVDGIEAIASLGTTNLMVNLYSNDISYFQPPADAGIVDDFPRDTFQFGEVKA